MAGLAGELAEVDADLADRAFPLVVEVGVEHQGFVRRYREPAVGLDLGIELPGSPAGIAQRQQAVPRAAAGGQSPSGCRGWPSAPPGRRRAASPSADSRRSAARSRGPVSTGPPKWTRISSWRLLGPMFSCCSRSSKVIEPTRAVDDQPHGAVGTVGAHIDHRAGEARVAHLRHGDQQLAGQVEIVGIVSLSSS